MAWPLGAEGLSPTTPGNEFCNNHVSWKQLKTSDKMTGLDTLNSAWQNPEKRTQLTHAQTDPWKLRENKLILFEVPKFVVICYAVIEN